MNVGYHCKSREFGRHALKLSRVQKRTGDAFAPPVELSEVSKLVKRGTTSRDTSAAATRRRPPSARAHPRLDAPLASRPHRLTSAPPPVLPDRRACPRPSR